jgi:hypothetical protein
MPHTEHLRSSVMAFGRWIRLLIVLGAILAGASALLALHFYIDRLIVTIVAGILVVCLLHIAFGRFQIEALFEALAFGVALAALLVLALVASLSGQSLLAAIAVACAALFGAGALKIIARNLPESGRRRRSEQTEPHLFR